MACRLAEATRELHRVLGTLAEIARRTGDHKVLRAVRAAKSERHHVVDVVVDAHLLPAPEAPALLARSLRGDISSGMGSGRVGNQRPSSVPVSPRVVSVPHVPLVMQRAHALRVLGGPLSALLVVPCAIALMVQSAHLGAALLVTRGPLGAESVRLFSVGICPPLHVRAMTLAARAMKAVLAVLPHAEELSSSRKPTPTLRALLRRVHALILSRFQHRNPAYSVISRIAEATA